MKLSELVKYIPGAEIIGNDETEVKLPRYDSRMIAEGDLFCALQGAKSNGNDFIEQAQAKGAEAVLTAFADVKTDLPVVLVHDDRLAMAQASLAIYDNPTKKINLIGITGTNGKTSSTFILRKILENAGYKTGIIGTLGYEYEGKNRKLARTTPEAPDLLEIISKMHKAGVTHVIMEVTSIATVMHRVSGFIFKLGIFTNFSQDHLDIHSSMEEYFLAKKLFFNMLLSDSVSITNIDDPKGKRIVENTRAKVLTYGFDSKADYQGKIISESPEGLEIEIYNNAGDFTCFAPLVGSFNAENVLACVSAARSLEISSEDIVEGLKNVQTVPGRMESVNMPDGITAVLDYAHTPDALSKALKALIPMTKKKLIVVFGAGGDRDKDKRHQMGRNAELLADRVILTSDNPRTEDPELIIQDICSGIESERVVCITDRREAIEYAFDTAQSGDVILLAGKGAEAEQEINGVKHHFSDMEELLRIKEGE